jgi:hypothetical protein
VNAWVQSEPAEQRACPPALGHWQGDTVRLERERAEQADAEHGNRLSPAHGKKPL